MNLRKWFQRLRTEAKKQYPHFWPETYGLITLLTIIITYLVVTYMASFDHRHYENRKLLLVFYICDVIYIADTVFRFTVLKVHDKKKAQKNPTCARKFVVPASATSGSAEPPSSLLAVVTGSHGSPCFRKCKLNCKYFWSLLFWQKYYTFWLDVLSILPFELFIFAVSPAYLFKDRFYLSAFAYLKLNRLIRLYRIYAYYRRKTHELGLNLTGREVLAISICFGSFLVITFHGLACIRYRLSYDGVVDFNIPPEFHGLLGTNSTTDVEALNNTHPYYSHVDITKGDAWGWYVGSIHWSVTSLRSSGNRYFSPLSQSQLIITLFVQVFGFLLGSAITLVTIYVASQIDLKRSIFFHEAYSARTFVRHFKLGRKVKKYVNDCFNFMWHRNRGFTDYNIKPIFCKSMKTKISISIFKPMIAASEILNCFSEDELERLSLEVQYKHYFHNEFIIRPDTVGHEAFYIMNGTVEIMSEEDPTMPIFTLSSGSLIGEVNLLFPTRRYNGIKTRTAADVLYLSHSSVEQVSKFEPGCLEEMTEIIKARMDWVAQQNERTFAHELNLVKREQEDEERRRRYAIRQQGSTATSESGKTESSRNSEPVHILLRRRAQSVGRRAAEASGTRLTDGPTAPRKKQVAAQFMSVLAWLNFYRGERRVRRTNKGRKYIDIYKRMELQHRNAASVQMYKEVPTVLRRPRYLLKRLSISKKSLTYQLWELLVMLVTVFNMVVYPIQILIATPAFCDDVNIIVETIYSVDLLLRLVVFMDPDELLPYQSSLLAHVKREFRTWTIWLDVLAVFPLHHILRYNLVLYRDYMYARIHIYIFKTVKLLLYIKDAENNVIFNEVLLRLLKHMLFMLVFIVWLGSTFTYLGCPNYPKCNDPMNSTWVDTFINASPDNDYSKDHFIYALPLSIFWAICAAASVQFDIVEPSTRQETALQTFGLLSGFAIVTYFCADIAASLAGALEKKIQHVDKIVWLTTYMDEALCEYKLIHRVEHYMDVQWKTLRGLKAESATTLGFLSVSHTMYTELVVHIVAECLFQTYFFENMDTDLLRKFCLAATLVVIPPHEVILKSGDTVTRMYIIRRGFVQVYYGNKDIKMDVLSTGQSFGEVNMFHGSPSKVTVRSISYVEIIMLDLRAFERILPLSRIHENEIAKFRSDKEGLEKFDNYLDSAIEGMTEEELEERTFKEPTIYPSLFVRKFNKTADLVDAYGIQFVSRNIKPSILDCCASLPLPTCCEKCRCRRCLMPVTILPNGVTLKTWETMRAITICLIMFFVPIIEAFPTVKESGQHYMYMLDLFTFVDMYVRAHVAYYDKKSTELVTITLKTTRHYLVSGFLLDLLGSLPVYLIINYTLKGTEWDDSMLAYVLRLNRLVFVYRIIGLYVYHDEGIAAGKPTRRMMKMIPLFFYKAHIVGCMLVVLACPSTMEAYENTGGVCYNSTWASTSKHHFTRDTTWSQLYVSSLYFAATTSLGCGFGDFRPSNQLERDLTIVYFFIHIFLITFVIASIAGSKSHIDFKLLRFQQSMKYLAGFIAKEKLDGKLTSRVIRHYNYQWVRTQGIEPQKLFSNLFPSLRKEVALDVFGDVLNEIPELHGTPEAFLRSVCAHLVPIYFLCHDIIVRKDDIGDMIYFVFRGKIAVSAGAGENGQQVELSPGGVIGTLDPKQRNPVYAKTAVSITNVDVFAIARKDFIRVVQTFPEVAPRFEPGYTFEFKPQEKARATYEKFMKHLESLKVIKRPSPRKILRSQHSIHKEQEKHKDESSKDDDSEDSLEYDFSEYAIAELVLQEGDIKSKTNYEEDAMYSESMLPQSTYVTFVTWIAFLSCAISTSLAFYQWSFEDNDFWLFSAGYICDIIFIVKIFTSFRIGYFTEQGDIVTDRTDIRNKYLSEASGFSLDFASIFPFELFTIFIALSGPGRKTGFALTFEVWRYLRMNRLFRVCHVVGFYKRRTSGFLWNLVPIKLERMLVGTLMYLHFMACFLYAFTAYDDDGKICDCKSNQIACNVPEGTEVAWFQTKKGYDAQEGSHLFCSSYEISLYFVLTAFTTTAYGDVWPITKFEMIYATFVALSSKIWLGIVLSDILSGLQNNINLSFHLAAETVLALYKDYGVPKVVLEQTVQYFTYAWGQNKGILFPDFLARAPASLKMDICTSLYGDHFRKSYLFSNLSESFNRQACSRLKTEWVIAGDFIVREGEIDDKLYFIHRGIVDFGKHGAMSIIDIKLWTSGNHGYISKSKYFGEAQGILGSRPHLCTYKAETNVDLVYLTHVDIDELFNLFPECRQPIMQRFYGRYSGGPIETSDFEYNGSTPSDATLLQDKQTDLTHATDINSGFFPNLSMMDMISHPNAD